MKEKKALKDFSISELPSTRKDQFKDILKTYKQTLLKIGLILLVFSIPYILVTFLSDLYFIVMGESLDEAQYAEIIPSVMMIKTLLKVLSIMIFSIGLSGVSRIYRNLLFYEPVFFRDDFRIGIKQNYKQFLLGSFIYGIFSFINSFATILEMPPIYGGLSFGVTALVLLPVLIFVGSMSTLYNSKFGTNFKVSFFLFSKTILKPILLSLGFHSLLLLNFLPSPIFKVVIIILFVIGLVPILLLALMEFTYNTFDRLINYKDYPEIYKKGLYVDKD